MGRIRWGAEKNMAFVLITSLEFKQKILLRFSLNSSPQRQFRLVIAFFKFISLCGKTVLLLTFSK